MTEILTDTARIPNDIAEAVMLPASYAEEQTRTYPALEWLRANNPLGLAEIDGYDPVWLATKHADIMEIERNPKIFSSGKADPFLVDRAGREYLKAANNGARTQDTLAYMDAPEHTKIKNVTSAWFMPANVRKREEAIRALARDSVDKLLAGEREVDIVKDFSLYYPLRVIMTLFGVPPEDEPMMLNLTQNLFGTTDDDSKRDDAEDGEGASMKAWKATLQDFFRYFNELSADRRKNPTDDLASLIANAKVDGDYLPESFVNGYYVAIATAGHDTTSSTISGAIEQFARHPEQLEAVRADPSLIPGVVDEALRWASPVKHFFRIVAEDTEFAGRKLSAGDGVMLMYPSANRDEEVFERPNEFDITRKPNKHLAFGFGPHQCVGQHVAKLEMRVLLEELLPRLAKVELLGEPQFVAANFLSGPKSLPVRITPA
ncbi:cytochrome P450 [Arthrobacter oryzae]|uniref:cytochrome P450 n=1 Tax=Arthrobacter oryzae TaxID=409290 RepID=UPI00278A257D|nr:cytochrome P450 [Arthrobacter oryzae]MDQ0078572.1 cytochrome P450 [Arthrobacter oryzae]